MLAPSFMHFIGQFIVTKKHKGRLMIQKKIEKLIISHESYNKSVFQFLRKSSFMPTVGQRTVVHNQGILKLVYNNHGIFTSNMLTKLACTYQYLFRCETMHHKACHPSTMLNIVHSVFHIGFKCWKKSIEIFKIKTQFKILTH